LKKITIVKLRASVIRIITKKKCKNEDLLFYDKECILSPFSCHPVHYLDTNSPTAEHAYQAAKFTHLVYVPWEINRAKTPELAKEIAKRYKKSRRRDWDKVKLSVMQQVQTAKVEQNVEVKRFLKKTKKRKLVENSPTDYFWGCGLDRTGENHLGKILMNIRDR
jgi:ribA/ribD-fused uncharacterized protein